MRKMIFTFMLTIVSSVWMMSEAGWCMSVAKAGSAQNIRIGGTFQAESMPCEDDTLPCPPCLTIALKSGGMHYLVSNDPQIVAILDTVTIGSFAIIEGNHYLEGHVDFINVTNIIFPQTDIQQLSGEWEISRETVSTPTGDGGTRWFSTHDVNYTNYVLADDLIYKVILDQSSGYAHYSDAVPYTVDRKEDGTWLLTAEGLFSSSNPVEEGIPSPATIYRLTEDEMEWMYAANGGDEGPDYYYQHLKRHTQKETKLPSLCDEWNVLEISNVTCGYCEEYRTYNFHLTTDTVIGGLLYSQLIKDGAYKGALREGNNRDIYCVPAGCSQEYLLYAFNAQVGDSLKNIWVGGYSSRIPDVRSAIVSEIKQTTPRTIELEVHYYEAPDAYEESIRNLTWIEGIGMPFGPMGAECSVFNGCADSKAKLLLCAYKNGEQVYVSEDGKKYGCEYDGKEQPRLPSLCDEWNILSTASPSGQANMRLSTHSNNTYLHTYKQTLTTDTIIGGVKYAKLEESGYYLGAMREGDNRDIYYIQEGSTHEYLLYAFNAQVGDTLYNMRVGYTDQHNGKRAVVREIKATYPRTFVVGYEFIRNPYYNDTIWWEYKWIEGIGLTCGPSGYLCPYNCLGVNNAYVLCAYKNGEQVYVSEDGKKYGCEYDGKEQPRLPSLCDEWNILGIATPDGYDHFHTFTQRLTTDTIIGDIHYDAKLEQSGTYLGAMREGYNRDIYYIPNGTTHEYLLYAFNAQAGDTLNNMWVGGHFSEEHNGKRAVVREIRDTSPRTFVVEYEYTYNADKDTIWWPYYWIEGVGMSCGPSGVWCPFDCEGDYGELVLCAYKKGEQIYISEFGKQYGCEYNSDEDSDPMFPSDTKWNYVYTETYGPYFEPIYFSNSPIDTVINNTQYQRIGGILFRSEGAKVWCALDSMGTLVERLMYDFGLQVGDSIRNIFYDHNNFYDMYYEEVFPDDPYYKERRYAKVTNVKYIELADGRSARHLSYDNRPDDIEHIGSIDGILEPLNMPVSTCGCGDHFLCCTRGDFLLYESYTGACDSFIVDHSGNIPLFARDDSGSSTVDPVDPNQVVASLRGNELIIQEFMGVEITFTLRHKEPAKTPSSHRAPQSDTFRDEVTIPITESGEYLLEMTNPSWGYTIFGEFDYLPQGIETVHSNTSQHKVLLNGRLYIHHGDHIYDTQGKMIK